MIERGKYMKRKLLSTLLIGSLCLSLCIPVTAYADGQKVVTLGADLTEDQKTAVLRYFGILGQNVKTLTITNQDERAHLGSYVPLEQIGSHTYSCALVCPTTSGGIQVKTANLSWVTSNMIATTLSTSGVVNCDVLAASPFEVSGTGALTGIIMAYEAASGVQLDSGRKDLATQELVTTGAIANSIGQSQATNIVNEIKIEIIQGQVVEPAEVEEIVDETIADSGLEVELSEEDRALLTGLMTQIAEQQYDYEEVQDTLQRVEDNLSDLNQQIDDMTEGSTELATFEGDEENEEDSLEEDSILLNTDDGALGENVIIDATNEEAVQNDTEAEAQYDDSFGFDITSSDSYGDGGETSDDFTTDWSTDDGDTVDDWSDYGTDEGDDWSFGDEGTVDDWSGDSGEVTDEWTDDGGQSSDDWTLPDESGEGDTDGSVEAGESLVLGQYCLTPDSMQDGGSQAAGLSQYKLLLEDYDLIPVSGTLTVSDSYGNICTVTDLSDTDQVKAAAVSEEDMQNGWMPGSKILINTGYALQPSENYVLTLDGVVASAADPSVTATVSTSAQVYTDSCGVVLNIGKVTDVYPGAALSGSVLMDDVSVYAEILDYDDTMISFSNTQFTPDASDFSLNCLQSGTTEFGVDFYDAEGNLLNTVYYELTILN